MSFLTRSIPRTARAATYFQTQAPRALFSTTFVAQKGPVEAVKDGLKTVDRKVSDKLVDGIEIGEKATQKVKETTGITEKEAKAKADELSGKASELKGEAKGKASELAGEAKGKKEEFKGKL